MSKMMNKMRNKTASPILSAVLGAFVLIGAAGAPAPVNADSHMKVEKKTEEAYQAVKKYGFEKKKDAVEWLKERQVALEIKLKALKAKAERAGKNTGEKAEKAWDKTIAVLEKKKDAAAKQADTLAESTKDAWETVKDGTVDAYHDLEKAVDDAVKKL